MATRKKKTVNKKRKVYKIVNKKPTSKKKLNKYYDSLKK